MLEVVGFALNITSNIIMKQLLNTIPAFFISSNEVWLLKITLSLKAHVEKTKEIEGF